MVNITVDIDKNPDQLVVWFDEALEMGYGFVLPYHVAEELSHKLRAGLEELVGGER